MTHEEKKNKVMIKVSENEIRKHIYNVRGVSIMLDKDLANLYGVETRVLNQSVRRNIERFPQDFLFQLTKEDCLKSQIVILKEGGRGKHFKFMPYAFTENGIAMLSGVLRSKVAIEINIRIMRAFSLMRNLLMENNQVQNRIDSIERRQNLTEEKVEYILKQLVEMDTPPQGVFILNDDGVSLGIETIHRRKINTSVLNGNTLVSIRHEGVINPNSTPANVGFSLDDNAGNKSSNYGAIEPNSSSEVKDQFSPRFSVGVVEKCFNKKRFF